MQNGTAENKTLKLLRKKCQFCRCFKSQQISPDVQIIESEKSVHFLLIATPSLNETNTFSY